MKKNARVIQISGLKGLIMVLFIGTCLVAGFVGFPAIVAMKSWNFLAEMLSIPTINILQGLLLWGFVAGLIFVLNDRKKYITAFKAPADLNDEEIRRVLERVRLQSQTNMLNAMLIKSAELKKAQENKSQMQNDDSKENLAEKVNEKRD